MKPHIIFIIFLWNFKFIAGFQSFDMFDVIKESDILNSRLNEYCERDLMEYLGVISNKTTLLASTWALQMLDSTAKVPNGLLTGTTVHMGVFDECINVQHPSDRFSGKHCMLELKLKLLGLFSNKVSPKALDRTIRIGYCIPSTCFAEDFNSMEHFSKVFTAYNDDCYTSEQASISSASWGFLSFMIILAILMVISTLYELYQTFYLKNNKINKILCSFSIYSNTINMIEIRDSSGQMACLHGIRTFSMIWVVVCHIYMKLMSYAPINLSEEKDFLNDPSNILIINGFYCVDSFFFQSGLLVAFVFFRNIGKNGYFDAPSAYLHRYLRLTPCFMFMVVFNITLLIDLNQGPMWNLVTKPEQELCANQWWTSLIYLQNYLSPDGRCLGQSWYLSADMQMFWISPLLLYPLYLAPRLGVAFLGLLTVSSTFWTFAIAYVNKFKASSLFATGQDQNIYDYIPMHTRIMPWLVGLALGFAICALKAKRVTVRLPKFIVLLGWISSTGICLGCLYGFVSFQVKDPAGDLAAAFYLSFTRLGWGLGLAWTVFACIYGYGGVVNKFLSLGIFQPLGKLSYNVFLIHLTIINYRRGTNRTNNYISDLDVIFEFSGTLLLSYLFAILLYLAVEAPTAVLDRELLRDVKLFPYPKPASTKKNLEVDNANLEKGIVQ